MRTTVEITEAQHRALSAVAQQRGLRGFSVLVQEAVDAYLHDLRADEVEMLLGLEGMIDDREEEEVRSRIAATRQAWRAS
jgi:metal-responsive CopG/Arc/MetJ family transcriptional regulator